ERRARLEESYTAGGRLIRSSCALPPPGVLGRQSVEEALNRDGRHARWSERGGRRRGDRIAPRGESTQLRERRENGGDGVASQADGIGVRRHERSARGDHRARGRI